MANDGSPIQIPKFKIYKNTKYIKLTKYELCNLYIIWTRNVNICFVRCSCCFSDRVFRNDNICFEMYLSVFCTIHCYFEYDIRILCIFLHMRTYFNDSVQHFSTKNRTLSQKCEQFSYELFRGDLFWIVGSKCNNLLCYVTLLKTLLPSHFLDSAVRASCRQATVGGVCLPF